MNVTRYRKGFSDEKEHQLFIDSVHEGDAKQICAVLKNIHEADLRLPVDALVNAVPRAIAHDRSAAAHASVTNYPAFGSTDHTESLRLVHELSKMRDTPLEELSTDLPKGLRVVSRYLNDVMVKKYAEGKDYGKTAAQHKKIQSGAKLATDQGNGETYILTGRDAAAYVHADDPVWPWMRMVKDLLAQQIPPTMPEEMQAPFPAQASFSVYGEPFFIGILGEALRKIGMLDFHLKWRDMLPRPEESGPVLLSEYISQAYAEGSPMHPRGPAMHSGAAWAGNAVIKRFWPDDQEYYPMADMDAYGPTTIHEEADLLADNVGYFRLHAGVHEEADHLLAREPAEMVVNDMTRRLVA